MKKKNRFSWGTVVLIAILLYFGYLAMGQQKMIESKNAELAKIQSKIEAEIVVNEELQAEKDTLDSDEYIEKTAREKLNMVKQGEKVFVDAEQ